MGRESRRTLKTVAELLHQHETKRFSRWLFLHPQAAWYICFVALPLYVIGETARGLARALQAWSMDLGTFASLYNDQEDQRDEQKRSENQAGILPTARARDSGADR